MSITAQFYLAIGFMVVELLVIVVYALLSSDWLGKKFADKIERATIHVWNGKGYDPFKGQLIDTTTGYTYRYKAYGTFHEVDLDDLYPVQYEKRKRIIYAEIGSRTPRPLPGQQAIMYSETEIARKMAIESVKAAFTAIKKKGFQLSWTIILIAALVVVAVGGGLWYYNNHNKPAPKATPAVITTRPVQQ